MSEEEIDDESFPWADVDAARKNSRLQRKHSLEEGTDAHFSSAKACPKCGAPPDKLSWFYFESPKWTWEKLCGRAGWMTVCDKCHLQVDFFVGIMN